MTYEQHDEPLVRLDPQDARTAQVAGVEFARTLAGAPSAWFALALDEQQTIIRTGIQRAGYSARNAQLAASAFDAGARVEWRRITSTVRPETWGMA
jgi:hypothetical protein